MRSKMMMAATAAFALMACNQVELPQNQEARLDLQVRTGIATRGVITEKTLPSGSSVGLFVTDDSNVTYDGVSVANIRYTGTGEGDSQAWAADEDIMLSATKGTLRGYYPYSESVSDLTAIPVEATSYIQTDWMYATPVANLNNRNFTAMMTMNHALAGVRLSLVKGSYNGVGEITSVSLSSDGAATNAVLDATDGSLSSITGTGASYTLNETFSLATEKKSIDFITVPAGVEAPISLSVMMNGMEMVAEIPAVKLQSGKIFEYIVEVAAEGLLLQTLNVIEWNKIDKGTLELQPDNGGSTQPAIEGNRITARYVHANDYSEYAYFPEDNDYFNECFVENYYPLIGIPRSIVKSLYIDGNLIESDQIKEIELNGLQYISSEMFKEYKEYEVTFVLENITDLTGAFSYMPVIYVDFTHFDSSDVLDMTELFTSSLIHEIDFTNFKTDECTSFEQMFYCCPHLSIISEIENFNTENVTSLYRTFNFCENLTNSLDLSNWDVSNVTNMYEAFCGTGYKTLNLSNWDVSNADITYMFADSQNLETIIGIENFDVSNMTQLDGIFQNTGITSININEWDTQNIESCPVLFTNCKKITEIDLSKWNTSKISFADGMFAGCDNLATIKVGGNFSLLEPTHVNGVYSDDIFRHTLGENDVPGLNVTGTKKFLYPAEYDYSKILAYLPEGWIAEAYGDTNNNVPDIDFDGTVPDPFVEWARIQHKDGTLYTAEEWLAAETAGTVADADANGVVVLYSKYAVCPHIIHPMYSTNTMMWTGDTYNTLPGILKTGDENIAKLDVNGKANTDAMLAAVDNGIIAGVGAPAAQYCVDVIFANGQKGYLPAAGELQAWFDNKTAVNACMDAINGNQVDTQSSWSSTQWSNERAWFWTYINKYLYDYIKNNKLNVRPAAVFEYN